MATYKVPQDVEAEDKLLGPFSFRQFIYLIVAAIAGFLAFGLSRVFIGLVVIPLPIMAFFLILALPLKKDQPMETYLTAIVRFWLKPRLRLWDPEGVVTNVEITNPAQDEERLTKEFSGEEASARLRYLSQIVDSGGWASRGMMSPTDNLHLSDTLVAEARSAEDMLDDSTGVAQNFDTMISRSDAAYKDTLIANMRASATAAPTPQVAGDGVGYTAPATAQVTNVTPQPQTAAQADDAPVLNPDGSTPQIRFNPYPSSMRQKIVDPRGAVPKPPARTEPPAAQAQAPSPQPVSPDIMRLATNNDLSISTLAREAQRLREKDSEEVVVSLR
jgi:hypothetical protein